MRLKDTELQRFQKQIERGSTRLTAKTGKLRQMSLCYPIKLAFYCVCVLLLSCNYFYHFYFISIFLFLFHMFSFPCFISLFNCIAWLVFLILYVLSFNFPFSLHPSSNNTQLLFGYFLFWLSKLYISCHIFVFPVLL